MTQFLLLKYKNGVYGAQLDHQDQDSKENHKAALPSEPKWGSHRQQEQAKGFPAEHRKPDDEEQKHKHKKSANAKTDKKYRTNHKGNQGKHSLVASWSPANKCYVQQSLVFCLIEDLGRGNRGRRQNRHSRRNRHASLRDGGSSSRGFSP